MFKQKSHYFRNLIKLWRLSGEVAACFVFFVFIICLSGCQIFPVLPPATLSDAGWTIFQGQAAYCHERNAPEIAGEILVATNLDGRTLVQFTKSPFPLMDGQTTSKSWQIHLMQAEKGNAKPKTFSGPGKPPARVLILWLPKCLQGVTPPKSLSWKNSKETGWRIENKKSGEHLEGYLSP